MISWIDIGIVLSICNKREKYKIANIFTKDRGAIMAMIEINSSITSFSTVNIEWRGKSDGALGFWRIIDLSQNWLNLIKLPTHTFICQRVCSILSKILPPGVKFSELFEYVQRLAKEIHTRSTQEAMRLYACFEFLLLKASGYGFDLQICGVCGQRELIEFISPKTGQGISSRCAGRNSTRLFEVPDIWRIWDNNGVYEFESCLIEFAHSSIAITNYFIEKHLLPPNTLSIGNRSHLLPLSMLSVS
ncbi:MAG: DNA repair protein RecO C-terminal domain-containing protein [Holosporales bacterium]|jgi:DNA repair protein RecO|nr:DNA repair protein RecO C-terminal domain-containing protein [Holosporales bacterium]